MVLGNSTDYGNEYNSSSSQWIIPDKVGYDALVSMCDPESEVDEIAATLEDTVTYGDLILSTPTLQLCITAAIGIGGVMGAATRKVNPATPSSATAHAGTRTQQLLPTTTTTPPPPTATPPPQTKTSASWDPSVSKDTNKDGDYFDIKEEDPIAIVNGLVMCGQAMSTAQFVCGLPRMGEYAYDMKQMVGRPLRHRMVETTMESVLKALTKRNAVPRYIDAWLDILHVQCEVDVEDRRSGSPVLQHFVLNGKRKQVVVCV